MRQETYSPTDRARFKISRDRWSRERIEFLRSYLKEIRERFPGVTICFGLFGSLTKGKELTPARWFGLREGNLNRTDVDLQIYYDDDELRQQISKESASNILSRNSDLFIPQPRIDINLAAENDARAARLRAIFVEQVTRRLKSRMDKRGTLSIVTYVNPIQLGRGRNSLFFSIQELLNQMSQPTIGGGPVDQSVPTKRHLARAFHLDFGGGLKRYRVDLLQQLSNLPPGQGERAWAYVNDLVRNWERPGYIPSRIERQFPRTLAEALRHYRVPPPASSGNQPLKT